MRGLGPSPGADAVGRGRARRAGRTATRAFASLGRLGARPHRDPYVRRGRFRGHAGRGCRLDGAPRRTGPGDRQRRRREWFRHGRGHGSGGAAPHAGDQLVGRGHHVPTLSSRSRSAHPAQPLALVGEASIASWPGVAVVAGVWGFWDIIAGLILPSLWARRMAEHAPADSSARA
ncbi:MAG: hypothetical protein EPN34_08690 [Burkholderiaceae bacterium]|nr:MAG: hypothetical protein EPN34_08690 [Burkholderiaceae bacterium]